MMKKIWTLLPVMAAFAAPAYAQDTGFSGRAEVRGGYDQVRGVLKIDDDRFSEEVSEKGLTYGVEAGADFRITSNVLLGAYVGADFSDVDDCSDAFGGDEACIEAGRNFTAGVRVGLPLAEGSLLYAKFGYSNAKLKGSYREDIEDVDSELFSGSDTVGGYHLGAGFELGLNQLGVGNGLYVKAEYVHTRYKFAFKDDVDDQSFNPTRHQILAGVGIRFGTPR